mmetsp:Transcript_4453/g.14699  ORF Transcript_4453/g.14699 Transcript_4453/m.14699 type:complete len:735 (-) Transcript_4453:42-2246(-)
MPPPSSVARVTAVDVVDVRIMPASAARSGGQRARLSRAVVEALGARLGAPIRITIRARASEEAPASDSDAVICTCIALVEPWDERTGLACEVDVMVIERSEPAVSSREAFERVRASTASTYAGTIELLELKPVACSRVRVTYDGEANEFSRSQAALRRLVVRLGSAAADGRCTIDRIEPRVDGESVSFRITDTTTIDVVRAEGETSGSGRGANAETRVAASARALQALRQAIAWPMKYGAHARALGVTFPRGLLLHGPPGTGKTEAVRAVAEEAGAKVHAVSSGDVFGAYAGESEKRLRKIFDTARREAKNGTPTVIMIDELDAICPTRKDGNAHETRIVAQLLTLMDGASASNDIVVPVIATTSRPNAIDPALRRPGRFDKEVEMSLPNMMDRAEILKLHAKSIPLASDVNFTVISESIKGYSGADIAALCREAAMCAIQRVRDEASDPDTMEVRMADFQASQSRVRASVVRGVAIDLPPISWDDIGGLVDVKKRLRQAVEWPLHHADAFRRLGLRPPKGILLHGPPGCAKTTLARAAATASGATVITLTAADVFSKYLGDGEKILRSTFTKARKSAPAVLLLDEIDGMCGSRGDGASEGAHDVATRLLSVFLTEMDGLETVPSTGAGVLVIATTNRPQSLDPALTRPGRLDLVLEIPPLDLAGRIEALRVHTRDVSLDHDVNIDELASIAVGYTGAELRHAVKEAALAALREDMSAEAVRRDHFVTALSKQK